MRPGLLPETGVNPTLDSGVCAPKTPPDPNDIKPDLGLDPDMNSKRPLLPRITRRSAAASARHPKLVLGLWLALIAGLFAAGNLIGTEIAGEADFGTGESKQARELVAAAGLEDPLVENILVSSDSAPATAAAARQIVAETRALEETGPVRGPEQSSALTTAEGRVALVQVTLDGESDEAGRLVEPVLASVAKVEADNSAVTAQVVGPGSFEKAIDKILTEDLRKAELISLPVTLFILLLAFGAVVAASVPLFLGVTAVIGAIGGMGLISQLEPMDESAMSLVILMGLAVGVDYSLFYIRREREERRAGRDADAALNATAATVGRAIVISGLTVVVALCGLLLTGLGFFISMGAATMLVVALAVLGSLTALPALLALLGHRVDRGRLPGLRQLVARRERRRLAAIGAGRPFGVWARLADAVTRRPTVALVIALCLLGTIAIPALEMRTGNPGSGSLPADTPIIAAERAINEAFPGAPASIDLIVSGEGLDRPEASAGLQEFGNQAGRLTGGGTPVSAEIEVAGDGRTALVRVPAVADGTASEERLVESLRSELAPEVATLIPGAERALVGGGAADGLDFKNRLNEALPLIIAVVLGLALFLMVASFRSLPLALAVIGLNLVSVAAAYGALTVIFQNSWAEGLLGFTSFGAVVDWVPIFVFVILFALSMDYTVLVLERMQEARRKGLDARAAAREGVAHTAGAVTSAAVVMVAIFMIFPTLPLIEMKMLGLTLAIGILLDATIVRGLALPAVVALLGNSGLRTEEVALNRHPEPGPDLARSQPSNGARTWDDHQVAAPETIASDGRT